MTDGYWIVNVQYKGGPTEIHGGLNTNYPTMEQAQEVADELVTYEYGVTSAWPEYVPTFAESLNPNHLGE